MKISRISLGTLALASLVLSSLTVLEHTQKPDAQIGLVSGSTRPPQCESRGGLTTTASTPVQLHVTDGTPVPQCVKNGTCLGTRAAAEPGHLHLDDAATVPTSVQS